MTGDLTVEDSRAIEADRYAERLRTALAARATLVEAEGKRLAIDLAKLQDRAAGRIREVG